MEGSMRNRYLPVLAVSALALLAAGCGGGYPPQQQGYQGNPGDIAIGPQAPDEHTIYVAPNGPPPPRYEVVPPAPGPTVYWQPGHWGWTGAKWIWLGGHYEQRPNLAAVWVPGQWTQTGNGFVWVEGHWQ
jgi:hypothetical protein